YCCENKVPAASSQACETIFSEAISSISFCWRCSSLSIACDTSGSASFRCLGKNPDSRASGRLASLDDIAITPQRLNPSQTYERFPHCPLTSSRRGRWAHEHFVGLTTCRAGALGTPKTWIGGIGWLAI